MGQNTAPSIATLNSPPQRFPRLGWSGAASCSAGFRLDAIMLIVEPVKVKATPANPTAGSALCRKRTERGKRIGPNPAHCRFVRLHSPSQRVAFKSDRHGYRFIPNSPTSYGVNPDKLWGECLISKALSGGDRKSTRLNSSH